MQVHIITQKYLAILDRTHLRLAFWETDPNLNTNPYTNLDPNMNFTAF